MAFLNTTETHYAEKFLQHYKKVCSNEKFSEVDVVRALKQTIEFAGSKDPSFANTVRKMLIKNFPDKKYDEVIPEQ